MRLLVVSNLYPPDVHGGYELLCHDVVECLLREKMEIRVLTSVAPRASRRRADQEPEVHRRLQLTAPFSAPPVRWFPRSPVVDWTNMYITWAVIRQFRPHGALVFSLRRLGLAPLEALRRANVPTAYVLNDEHLEAYRPVRRNGNFGRQGRWLLEHTLQRPFTTAGQHAFHPITISAHLAHRLSPVLPCSATVELQGIPLHRFTLKEFPGAIGDPPRLIYCGRLHPDKGVHTALESLAILENRGTRAHLTIVGSGEDSYQRRLTALARMVDGQVSFIPWVKRIRGQLESPTMSAS